MRIREQILKHLPALGSIVIAHLIIYHDHWSLYKIFTGSDFFQLFTPLINFQSDCIQEGSWPLWNPYLNFGFPWVDHYLNSSLFPTHLIPGFFLHWTVQVYQVELLLWIFLGGVGVYLLVLELGHSGLAAVLSAIAFMFSGPMLSAPQWGSIVYNASSFPFLLLGYHRAKRTGYRLSIISSVFLALQILGGYTAATVLSIYLFGAYVLFDAFQSKRWLFGVQFIFVTLFCGALLSLPKIIPLYNSLASSPRLSPTGSLHPNFDTAMFDIVTPYNFLSFLLPVKYYFSLYAGQLAVMVMIHGAVKRTLRIDASLVLFILCTWFLISDDHGNISLLRYYGDNLPFMGLVRVEFLYWFYPVMFVILFLSRHLDGFIHEESIIVRMTTAAVALLLLSGIFILAYDYRMHANAFLVQFGIVCAWASIGFLRSHGRALAIVAVCISVFELFLLFGRVNVDVPAIRGSDYLEMTITHQQGVSNSVRDNQMVKESWVVKITPDDQRPSISDSKSRPYLVPVTPGFPRPNWSEVMNQKYFTGWWYNPQESYAFSKLKESRQFPLLTQQPLFVFIDRSNGGLAETEGVFEDLSCSSFTFNISTAVPGALILRQMFDRRWRVFVDGRQHALITADEYFMAVEVEPGNHRIEFRFQDEAFTVSVMISVIALICLLAFTVRRFILSARRTDVA